MASPEPITPKTEFMDSEDISPKKRASTEEHAEESPTKKAKTPRKKAAPKGPQTPSNKAAPKEPNTPASSRKFKLPFTYAEAGPADRMLIKMKDEGKSTKEIKAAYEAMTGKAVGDSTLSVRISRLKANFACLDPGHDMVLLEAEKQFEEEVAKLLAGKHARIAKIMTDMGTQQYNTMLIIKEYKRIKEAQADGTFVPSVPGNDGNGDQEMGEDAQVKAEAEDEEESVDEDADGEE